MIDLACATVAGMTPVSCTIEVIDIKGAAVSHLNVGGQVTTV